MGKEGTEKPDRRTFVKYLTSGVVGAGIASAIGGAGYLSIRSEVSSLDSRVSSLNSQVGSLNSQIDSLKSEKSQLEAKVGSVGYIFGKGYAAAIDLSLGKLVSFSRVKLLEEKALSYSNHRLDQFGRIWGTGSTTGEVLALDPATVNVEGKVQLPGRWRYALMDISPDGKFAYVLNLLVVSPKVKDEDLQAPKPKVKIEEIEPSFLHKIDTSTFKLVSSLEVARFACDVDISPDGRYLYLPNQLDHIITVVDLNTYSIKQKISGQIGGSMLTVSPNGKWVFIEVNPSHNWGPEDIKGENVELVVDAETNKVVKSFPLDEPPGINEFSPDGRYTIVTLRTKVAVFDTSNLSLVATIPINGPGTLAYSPDSRYAYIPSRGDKAIQVVDLKTFKVARSIKLPEAPGSIIPVDLKRF